MLTDLTYSHDGVTFTGRLASPAGPGPHPGVLVMFSARGLTPEVEDRARRLAELGYVALATDMYGVEIRPQTMVEQSSKLLTDLHANPDLLRARVLAGFEALAALPQVDAARIGAIGFCFGGECVLDLARSGAAAQAVVSFHGLLGTKRPAEPGGIKAKVLVLTGDKDPFAPPPAVEAFQKEMRAAQANWQLTIYSQALHAFSDPTIEAVINSPGIKYDPLIDKLSWAQATAFLEACLTP